MRVLVAGASGVLGQPTVRALLDGGHNVVGIARDERAATTIRELGAEAVPGDITDASATAKAFADASAVNDVEAVVNATGALPAGKDGKAAFEQVERVWHGGTRNLLVSAQDAGVQVFVQVSLGLLYGEQGETWVTEETPLSDRCLIGAALAADQAVAAAAKAGLPTVTLRLGTVYGRDAWHTRLLAQQARKRALTVVGDGKAYWSLIHADDAGRAIARAVEDAGDGTVYNLADDRPMPMADLLGLIARLTGAPQPSRVPALMARMVVGADVVTLLTTSIRMSNRAIKQDLELSFEYPTPEEGLRQVLSSPVPDPD
jgi:nucleoside-diphosphate-sugar epimerase